MRKDMDERFGEGAMQLGVQAMPTLIVVDIPSPVTKHEFAGAALGEFGEGGDEGSGNTIESNN